MIAVYCVINVVIQSVIQPKVVGDVVGLSATVSFLSLVFWTWVIGPLGAILAIPLNVLAKALLLDADPRTRWLSTLISGGRPAAGADPAPASRSSSGSGAAPAAAPDPGPGPDVDRAVPDRAAAPDPPAAPGSGAGPR